MENKDYEMAIKTFEKYKKRLREGNQEEGDEDELQEIFEDIDELIKECKQDGSIK